MVLPFHFFFFLLFIFFNHHVFVVLTASGDFPLSFNCGNLGNLTFPYTTPKFNHYGMLPIHGCEDNEHPNAPKTVLLGKYMFQVMRIEGPFNTHVVVRNSELGKRLESNHCDALCCNITLPDTSPLGSFHIFKDTMTFYKCNSSLKVTPPKPFLNYTATGCGKDHNETIFFRTQNEDDPPPSLAKCPRVQLPVDMLAFSPDPFTFIASEFSIIFEVSQECTACGLDKGWCRLDKAGRFCCFKSKGNSHEIETEDRQNKRWAIIIGFFVGSGILILALVLCFRLYNQKQSAMSHVRFRSMNQYSNNEPDPDNGRLFFGVPIFSYMELQQATKNFDPSNKLGDGGFGSVYHGQLQDGREVAVKHLFSHNYKRVEQFMTEVEILTRLRHKNLVSLYGCTSRESRELLLVYEYISNGTLSSHLHGDSTNTVLLTWPIRIKIAIETATALAYLHASGIIHRDVKTNNILLDKNFCVKVADFGLSRLFPDDVSHVSTAPQGTPGYLDPEYHSCFKLTNKSDVYSFGVVLMELISSMPAVDMGRDKEEITLANLALRKIRKGEFEDMVDPCLGIEKDSELKKKVVALGEMVFQCLQIDKEMRPSIHEVLEVLKEIEGENEEDKDAWEDGDGSEISRNKQYIHTLPVTSISCDQATLFKSASSPINLIEKWTKREVHIAKLSTV